MNGVCDPNTEELFNVEPESQLSQEPEDDVPLIDLLCLCIETETVSPYSEVLFKLLSELKYKHCNGLIK